MNFTEEFLKENGIVSVSLITEATMAAVLIIKTFNHGEYMFKGVIDPTTVDKHIDEVINEIKVYQRNEKINKIKGTD